MLAEPYVIEFMSTQRELDEYSDLHGRNGLKGGTLNGYETNACRLREISCLEW